MERSEISTNLKWDLTHLFTNDEAWESEYKAVEEQYLDYDLSPYIGNLGDKTALLSCLRLEEEISNKIERLYLYAHMRHDEDLRVAKFII